MFRRKRDSTEKLLQLLDQAAKQYEAERPKPEPKVTGERAWAESPNGDRIPLVYDDTTKAWESTFVTRTITLVRLTVATDDNLITSTLLDREVTVMAGDRVIIHTA